MFGQKLRTLMVDVRSLERRVLQLETRQRFEDEQKFEKTLSEGGCVDPRAGRILYSQSRNPWSSSYSVNLTPLEWLRANHPALFKKG